jgi:hypothetical protein
MSASDIVSLANTLITAAASLGVAWIGHRAWKHRRHSGGSPSGGQEPEPLPTDES